MKYNTSATDPPNIKALTAWNDGTITHWSVLNPAQVHDPRFVKKSFSVIYTSLIHLAHAPFLWLPSSSLFSAVLMKSGIICTVAHMVLDP